MNQPLKIFMTYAHADATAKDKLKRCLAPMARRGEIAFWCENEMLPTDTWREAISNHLADADLLLYLVSANSLTAAHCNGELSEALNVDSNLSILPIFLEACDWQRYQLNLMQALPDRGRPIDKWRPESKGWQSVAAGIRKVVKKRVAAQKKSTSAPRVSDDQVASLGLQLGNFKLMLEQREAAIEAYSHAIALKPNFAEAYNNRGTVLNEMAELDRAIRDFNKAIALRPNLAEAYYNRGTAYGFKSDHDRAMQDYEDAIKLKPNIIEAYYNLGVAHAFKNDLNRAIQYYNKAIKLKSDFVVAYNNRGIAYLGKRKYDLAIRDFNKAIALNPMDANPYVNRGSAYYDKGDYDRAIQDLDKAMVLEQNPADVYRNRGIAYYARGIAWLKQSEWDKAKADLAVAKEMRFNIAATLRREHGGIANFEQKYDIVLPNDIAAMLWSGF